MLPRRFASGRFGGVKRLPGHQIARAIANNFGGDVRQALLDGAPLLSELLHTTIPQRAAPGTTASFTRATTGTVQDNEGILRTAIAGEARFTGARGVRNLLASTTTLSTQNVTTTAGTYILSFYGTGSVALSGTVTDSLAGTGASTRVNKTVTCTAGTLTLTVTGSVTSAQLENITGRADQTTPSEYVSVGVLSAPYHGAGVDGVKYFDTDLSGNPLTTLKGYLAEGARTNLCLQSQTFDNASWTKAAAGGASIPVVTADQGVAPDGTTTADKVVFVAPVSGDLSILSTSPVTSAGTYTGSIYIKAFAAGDVGKVLCFRHVASATYTLITLTAAWQRVSSTEVRAVNTFEIVQRPSEGSSTGTVSVYLWGAQVELGSFASSYIATTTVAVARNADVLTYSSAGNIDGTKGWCYAEISANWDTPTPSNYCAIGFGTSIEGLITGFVAGLPTEIRAFDGTNSVQQAGNPTMYRTPRNTAVTWGGSSMSVGQSGVVTAGSFDGNIGTTAIGVGNSGAGAFQWSGTIRNIRIGQRQLSSSELQAVTA